MIDFLGIGAQKAGTTWLFEHLSAHPQISFPAGKEIHFWDRRWDGRPDSVQRWLDVFSKFSRRRQGEITPAYAILNHATVREVYNACPDTALFFSLRNPMERAWSSALMILKRSEIGFHEVSDRWFIDVFRSQQSVRRSNYVACIDTWTSVFPADRLHIIWFDDIVTKPRAVLQALARHIGADASFYDRIATEKLNVPIYAGLKLPVRKQLITVLQDLHLAEIEILAGRFGRDLRNWTEWTGADAAVVA